MTTSAPRNTPLLVSVTALVIAVLVIVFSVPALLGAVFLPSADEGGFVQTIADLRGQHEESLEIYRERFDGRSVFFKPPQPRRVVRTPPPAPRTTTTPRDLAPPPPPPDPVRPPYSGPKITAMLGDEVWFHGNLRLRVGEEKNGLKLLDTDAPWSAQVNYGGWEYDVPLWERSELPLKVPAEATAPSRPLAGLVEVAADEVAPTAPAAPITREESPTSRPAKEDEPVADATGDLELHAERPGPDESPAKAKPKDRPED